MTAFDFMKNSCRLAIELLLQVVLGRTLHRLRSELRDHLAAGGVDVTYETLSSMHGHEGFLIEFPELGDMLDAFLAERLKNS